MGFQVLLFTDSIKDPVLAVLLTASACASLNTTTFSILETYYMCQLTCPRQGETFTTTSVKSVMQFSSK